jgi:2-C-methyl-D-erythritol 4-phosphate cytidylyltransferase
MKNKAQVVKAIILAGGYSRRMKSRIPKQLLRIANKPVLAYTLDTFERCKPIKSIILVVHQNYVSQCRNLIEKYGYRKIEQLVIGGRTRQQSVFNALSKIEGCDYVIVHDGVRPLVRPEVILKLIRAVKKFAAVTCAVKATDTIVEARRGFIRAALCRDELWQIQTPQAFKFDLALKAHRQARLAGMFDYSDDAQPVLKLKNRIKIVKGSRNNLKVTTAEDLYLTKLLLLRR